MADVESRSAGQRRFSQDDSPENPSLNLLKKLEFLQQEVQELRGKVEEQSYKLNQVQEQNKKLYQDLDKRMREGGPAKTASTPITSDQETLHITNTPSPEANTSSEYVTFQSDVGTTAINALQTTQDFASEEKAYQHAYRLIQNKDYDGAMTAFKAMVQQYPQGKYAPNAQYWLGEIYLVKGNLDLAGNAFDIVYRQYPKHPKAADSLLKLGYVEYGKGQWKRSQELLNQVKSQFPGTTSAQLADSRLQKMQQEGHL
ncbi:MAG: tol-pal system protein YbgF [Gammaproteobacteria bacterium]|nr:tol-pal system protein YbgF [Gammaproteobacteria bacterium]